MRRRSDERVAGRWVVADGTKEVKTRALPPLHVPPSPSRPAAAVPLGRRMKKNSPRKHRF